MSRTVPCDFLRNLAEEVARLAIHLDDWLRQCHTWPHDRNLLNKLNNVTESLRGEASRLATGNIYVTIVFMGGTGVGKSTLLNALAGQPIAQTGVLRPTTREIVCYVHKRFRGDPLPHGLAQCIVWHEQDSLVNKVLVDAPDLDSTEKQNYYRLRQILPHADIILYIGSQEKYHDQIGWELFRELCRQKAFAFVLNRWDECIGRETRGTRPDWDWLRDLRQEGYSSPLLFRTCARYWAGTDRSDAFTLPVGEQFHELKQWLEAELGEKELLAIRQANLEALLRQCIETISTLLSAIKDANLIETQQAWEAAIQENVNNIVEYCASYMQQQHERLDAYLREQAAHNIPGFFSWTLQVIRNWHSPWAKPSEAPLHPPESKTKLADLVYDLMQELNQVHLRSYGENLINRLLAQAQNQGVPIVLLENRLDRIAKEHWYSFWKNQVTQAMERSQEAIWQPYGWHGTLRRLARALPGRLCWLAGIVGIFYLAYRILSGNLAYSPGIFDLILYFFLPVCIVEITTYYIASFLSRYNWREFVRIAADEIRTAATGELRRLCCSELQALQQDLEREIKHLEQLANEASSISRTLTEKQEEVASVKRLYTQGTHEN